MKYIVGNEVTIKDFTKEQLYRIRADVGWHPGMLDMRRCKGTIDLIDDKMNSYLVKIKGTTAQFWWTEDFLLEGHVDVTLDQTKEQPVKLDTNLTPEQAVAFYKNKSFYIKNPDTTLSGPRLDIRYAAAESGQPGEFAFVQMDLTSAKVVRTFADDEILVVEEITPALAATLALAEVRSAQAKFPPFNSAHEGFAVLLEEVDELKREVWLNQSKRNLDAMRKEATQVAAMAIRFLTDVCNAEKMLK